MLALSMQVFLQNDIKSAIPALMGQLEDTIQTLEKFSEQRDTKDRGVYSDEDVRAAAAHALLTLIPKVCHPFKERMESDKVIAKLLAELTDDNDAARVQFLETAMLGLTTVDKPVRTAVYKLLAELKEARSWRFLDEIDAAICKLLIQMKDKDISFIRSSVAI
ncbi:hypothetical protein BJ912DRAFT_1010020, partial [Pholiota molesta]